MIPLQIQLKNFLSYGPEPQTIDFKQYHLICLSGKNGHGKSALLDAITWAIWGQARKTSGNSKADQGLLHLGQKHMFVILEFEVNGQHYRVRREYVHTKSKPFASLDFGIKQDGDKFTHLTDKTIKATQLKIEKTIGITYDAFSNSTFLRQGQSNEFSKKSPKERKDILGNILQLQEFEDQKKIAQQHAKKLLLQYNTQVSIQHRIETELEELSSTPEQYKKVQAEIKTLSSTKKNLIEQHKELLIKKNKLEEEQKQHKELLQQQAIVQKNLNQTKQSIEKIALIWHQTDKQAARSNEKELKKRQEALQESIQKSNKALQEKLILKDEYVQIKEKLNALLKDEESKQNKKYNDINIEFIKEQEQLTQIIKQQKLEQATMSTLSEEIKAITIDIESINKEIQNNQKTITQYHQHEQEFETTKYQYQKLGVQGTLLKQKLNEVQSKINESSHQKICSLCQQIVNEESKESIKQSLSIEQTNIEKTVESLKEQATPLKKKFHKQYELLQQYKKDHEHSINITVQQEQLVKQLNKTKQQQSELQKTISQQEKQKEQCLKKAEKLKKDLTKQADIEKNITGLESVKSLRQQLSIIEQKAKKLGYNQQEHQKLEQELLEVNKQLDSYDNNIKNISEQADRKAQLFALFKAAQENTFQLQAIDTKLQQYKQENTQVNSIQELEQNLLKQEKKVEQEQADLLVLKGSLEQKQKKQNTLTKELNSLSKEVKTLHQELVDYQEIAKALGKDGIQALLIEQAIPEIEQEANKVLARLTHNQTQIFIESLRDLKKGGSKETLDIKISDSYGIRDYELFSGGEAFRIDFALRIGISKLLARKAGTTLQTIFIDEGFGSQDEEGLQLMMDNIYKVQDEFAKVIIVSHLPEMKEQFPVQFIVEKKRSGSTISIIEQG